MPSLNKKSLQAGDRVPDAILQAQDGRQIALADFKGRQSVVLFFYPADDTPICTREACAFRDNYKDFQEAGAVVIGVSGDSQASHSRFAEAHNLDYLLVADVDGSLRRSFGVTRKFGLLPGRVTFVINRDGLVEDVFAYQFSARKHVENALQSVRRLKAQETPKAVE
jgi:thioredoxin-dependent peroxiredoxin